MVGSRRTKRRPRTSNSPQEGQEKRTSDHTGRIPASPPSPTVVKRIPRRRDTATPDPVAAALSEPVVDGGHIASRFGIDKLAVQLAVAQAHPAGKWKWFNGQRGAADVEIRKGVKAHLYLYESPTRGPMADVEFNPSRLIDSEETWALCPVEDVMGTLEEVLAKLATNITPGEEPEMMQVSRLDVARDFLGVPNINATLRALSVNDPKSCVAKQVWFSTDGRNLAETLKFGGGSEYLQLYDKAAQMQKKRIGGRAPEGTLRYEVRARKDGWLGAPNEPSDFDGISVMAHVTRPAVEALAWHRWRWCGAGAFVVAPDLFQLYVAHYEPDPYAQEAFIGNSMLRALGLRPAPLKTHRRLKFMRLRRKVRVIPDPDLLVGSRTDGVLYRRLDLASGVEVETVA